jgi:hypothetical protein
MPDLTTVEAERAAEGNGNVKGTSWIRLIAVIGGTVVFALLYGHWMKQMWDAPPPPPAPDPDDVKIATALAGALGGLFAVAMGVKSTTSAQGTRVARAGAALTRVGDTLTGSSKAILWVPATLAVWTYFLAGLAAALTWQFNKGFAVAPVKTLAEVIGGYVIALIAAQAAAS